jgi:predicted nucleic acid-binding protein
VLTAKLSADQAGAALQRLVRWRGYRYPLTPLVEAASAYRYNLVIADALYVVLAQRLDVPLVTGDQRLANKPTCRRGSTW